MSLGDCSADTNEETQVVCCALPNVLKRIAEIAYIADIAEMYLGSLKRSTADFIYSASPVKSQASQVFWPVRDGSNDGTFAAVCCSPREIYGFPVFGPVRARSSCSRSHGRQVAARLVDIRKNYLPMIVDDKETRTCGCICIPFLFDDAS